MANKAVLNRQIQVLENSLIELRKHNNKTIDDINNKIRCPECKKVMIEYAKKRKRQYDMLSATLLGAFTPTDYSAEPYKLFEKEME